MYEFCLTKRGQLVALEKDDIKKSWDNEIQGSHMTFNKPSEIDHKPLAKGDQIIISDKIMHISYEQSGLLSFLIEYDDCKTILITFHRNYFIGAYVFDNNNGSFIKEIKENILKEKRGLEEVLEEIKWKEIDLDIYKQELINKRKKYYKENYVY